MIEMDSKNYYAYRYLGHCLERVNKFEESYETLEKALAIIKPDDNKGDLYIGMARVLQCMKRYIEAIDIYDRYIDEIGISYDLLYDYAELLQRMDKASMAIELLRTHIDQIEDKEERLILRRHLCLILGNEGYLDDARAVFEDIRKKYPEDHRSYKIMADIYKDNCDYKKAYLLYKRAIELDKDNEGDYYSSIVENEALRKKTFRLTMQDEIKAGFELERKEDAKTALDHIRLSRLYRVLKKYGLAIKAVEKAVEIPRCYGCFYSECHEAYYEMGLIYESRKWYKKAELCYRKALDIKGHELLYEKALKRVRGK